MRAAIWARTDREAAYLLSVVVQQGLVHPIDIAVELLRIKRHRRRLFVHAVVNDLVDGAWALGELDFARELRRRGLPPPVRQVLRKDRNGRYLDLYWPELKLVVEIDGIHHAWAENVVGMPCARTPWRWPATPSCGCLSSDSDSNPTSSSPRSPKRSPPRRPA